MTKATSLDKEKAREIAKAYVDRQLMAMKQQGLETVEVSTREYESMITKLAKEVKAA